MSNYVVAQRDSLTAVPQANGSFVQKNVPLKTLPVRARSKKSSGRSKVVIGAIVGIVFVIGVVLVLVASGVFEADVFIEDIDEEFRTDDNYVGVIFTSPPNQAQFDAFIKAAERWSEIIVENRINSVNLPGNLPLCGDNNPETQLTENTRVDHLTIFANLAPIDGGGGILGFAAPCLFDAAGRFPIIGTMTFDTADLARLENDGTLEAVILHEMGHVLGIGTLWAFASQGRVSLTGVPRNQRLIQNPVFTGADFNANGDPFFIGIAANEEFEKSGGVGDLPIEDGLVSTVTPNRADGRGSIDGHWDIDILTGELMVFAINANNDEFPLSAVTIGSLEDLGYIVDFSKADDFSARSRRSNLRKNIDTSGDNWVHLGKDVADIPMRMWDPENQQLYIPAVEIQP